MAAPHAIRSSIVIVGGAGLVAGALSMAADEQVSVRPQADTEQADIGREGQEFATNPAGAHSELAAFHVGRGLPPARARKVALQLMAQDGLGAHVRDEPVHVVATHRCMRFPPVAEINAPASADRSAA